MIQHASLMDVFNAAGQAASPFLREKTARLKEQNDLQIKINAEMSEAKINEWKRNNPYDKYDNDFDKYQDALKGYIESLYLDKNGGGYLSKNTSDYYQRQMGHVRDMQIGAAEGIALKAHDDWRMGVERRQCGENIQGGLDMDDAEQGWQLISDSVKLLKTQQNVTPEDENKMLQDSMTALYQRHILKATEGITDLDALEAAVNGVTEKFKTFMDPVMVTKFYEEDVYETDGDQPYLDEEGNPITDGKPAKLKHKKGDAVLDEKGNPVLERRDWNSVQEEWVAKVTQERAGAIIQEAEGRYQRLQTDGRYREAEAYAKEWGPRLMRCYDKDDTSYYRLIDAQQRFQFRDYFDLGRRRSGSGGAGGSGGGKGKKPDLAELDSLTADILEGVFQGTSGLSFNQVWANDKMALEPLWAYMEELAAAGNVSMQEALTYYNKRGGKLEFYTDWGYNVLKNPEKYLKRLAETSAPLAKWVSHDVAEIVNKIAKDQGKKSSYEQTVLLGSLIRDLAMETNFANVGEGEMVKRVNEKLGLMFLDSLKKTDGRNYKTPKAGDEKSMLEAAAAIRAEKDAIWSDVDGKEYVINPKIEKQLDEYTAIEQQHLEQKYPGVKLRRVGYQSEPGAERDIIGLGVYEDEGGRQYKLTPANGSIIYETRTRGEGGKMTDWRPAGSRESNKPQPAAPSPYEKKGEERIDASQEKSTFVPNGKTPSGWEGREMAWNELDNGMKAQYLENWSKDEKKAAPPKPVEKKMTDAEWRAQWNNETPANRLKILYDIYGQDRRRK